MGFGDKTLIVAIARNLRTNSMNREMVGHTISQDFGPIMYDDIFGYVKATRDDPSRYKEEKCQAPPFYGSRLLYPMFRYFLTNKELHLNILRLVHGYQGVTWLNPIYVGDSIHASTSIDAINETPAGELLILKTIITANEQEAAIVDTGFIVRRKGQRKNKKDQKTETYEEARTELFRNAFNTEEGQQLEYAEISGDRNFIHTNNFLAKIAGLPRTIIHGVCTAAMVTNTLLDTVLKGDMKKMKHVSMRFAQPVLPGEKITVVAYESQESGEIVFEAVNTRGKPVVKNGVFRFDL